MWLTQLTLRGTVIKGFFLAFERFTIVFHGIFINIKVLVANFRLYLLRIGLNDPTGCGQVSEMPTKGQQIINPLIGGMHTNTYTQK